jgi:Flp pilus assembly protein TadG
MMKKNRFKHPHSSERGQSLVELALSLTFILLLLAGVVDFGQAFFIYIQMRDAAQEGALYGSINPSDSSGINSRVRNSSDTPLDLTSADVNVNASIAGRACEGGYITVTITYDTPVMLPFIGAIIGDHMMLTATATDLILMPACL